MEEVKSAEITASDMEKVFAFISYVVFFGFLIYKNNKESDYVQFHAKQGMILFSASFIVNLIFMILPVLGAVLAFFVNIVYLVFFILGANNALSGKMEKVPLIGQFSNVIK
jgi:fumarate reductase subunit D